jgi:hypothetical protein
MFLIVHVCEWVCVCVCMCAKCKGENTSRDVGEIGQDMV